MFPHTGPADGVGLSFAYPSADNFTDFANHGEAVRPPHTILCAQLAVSEWLRNEFNVTEARAYKLVVCAATAGEAEHAAAALEVTLGDHEVSVTIDSGEWSDIVAPWKR